MGTLRAQGLLELRRGLVVGGGAAGSLGDGLGFLRRGCWLDPITESVWRERDPEIAAPGMISFLAFLNRPQTSGGPGLGEGSLEKGLWILALPSPYPHCQPHSA